MRPPPHSTGDSILPGTASAKGKQLHSLPDPAGEIRAVLASAVYDLSQPLTVLNGTLELLQAAGSLPAQAAQAVDDALLQAVRAMRITHLLLEYSEEESGDAHEEKTSLRRLLEEMNADLQALAEGSGCSVAVGFGGGGEAQFPAAPLRRAILRLAGQALEASPRGTCVEISLTGDAAQARIEIRDHGPALSPATLRRWFDLSHRLPSVPGRARSPLKLALLMRDVRAAGGRLLAADAEGQGVRFSIELRPI